MAPLTPSDVKRWDLEAIHAVFATASGRAATLQHLGDNLGQVHDVLADWHGEAGEAFRADVGKARRAIEADRAESTRVAAAVSQAETDVRACKTELADIEQAADGYGWTITPDWRIDVGDTGIGIDPVSFAAEQQALQDALDACKVHAHTADHELAAAIRGAFGDVPLDPAGGGTPNPVDPQGKSPSLKDMLLPTGAGAGDPARIPRSDEDMLLPAGGPNGKPPSLEDLLTGRGQPSGAGLQQPGSLSDMLSRLAQPAAAGSPAPQLKPAEVERFKAMARQTMADAGMPPDQIEAHLDEFVANAQQWMGDGGPHYVAPEGPSPPPPGFAEGFGDRWFAAEQEIKDLTGQEGLGALGDSWGGMAKGLAQKAEEFATQGPIGAGINDLTGEVHNFLDSPSPAYYAGGKAFDGAVALPGMLLGPEGAGLGEVGELDAAASLTHDLPIDTGGHYPTGIGDHDTPLAAGHPIADWSHSDDPYLLDGNGHYLPGSLPSYEQLQGITSTEPDTAYYWSGRNAAGVGVGPDGSGIAELIAHGSGGTTLEMTLAENGVDPLPAWNRHDPVSVQFWEHASAAYAENARGEVTAIIGSNVRPGNIWQTVEIPRLIENQDVTRIVQIDPDTGQSITIFERGKWGDTS